jgi:iron complex transport system substrate-binding protein
MKNKKTVAALLSAFLLTAVLAGCQSAPAKTAAGAASPPASPAAFAPQKDGPVTVTDMTGREIVFDEPITRIVAISPSDCEILYAVGAGDTLVGRGAYCDYPEAVQDIPVVESGADMSIEQVMALAPQVVLMTTMAQTKEQVAALEAAGAKVVASDARNIAGVYAAIELIGAIVDKNDEAAALVAEMRQAFADIESKAAGKDGGTVYFEVSPLEYGLWAAGSGTFMDELATMLDLTNIFTDVDSWGAVSEEQVIERDPDYIVTITMYYGEGPSPVEEILGRAGWQDMKAVRGAAIFNADGNELSRPGPRLVNAAETLLEFVYATMAQDAAA